MTTRQRLASIDIVRGAVMVLMAIDHVRVYSGVPAGGATAGIFFTRWVTHFCAPAFVFLAGTSAFLYGRTLGGGSTGRAAASGAASSGDPLALSRYLITRGLLLVLLELTIIRASWTFGVDYSQFVLAGVIWMLGWCMVLLAGLVFLPTWVVGIIGLVIIVFQDVFGPLGRALPESAHVVWEFLYPVGAGVTIGHRGPSVAVLYSIVPWVGVMAAGYALGGIMVREPAERRRLCLRVGLGATALFVAAAGLGVLLNPAPADAPPALVRFLNQRKYPASQLFLLMTLGPTIALLPVAERMGGWFARMLETFGRVPMFYYLLHIPLIHATALLVWFARDGRANDSRFATAPYVSIPPGERWGLPLLYLVFVIVVVLLYPVCRWFAGVKARRPRGWLRYV